MTTSLDLTIAIPVRNEERNLPGCLKAIGSDLARQIVVIDSGSTDHTKEIARQHGAEVVDFVWDGKFPKKRNWFLRNHTPATKWVLFLDADEYLTDEFKSELREVLKRGDKVGYWLNYTIYFLGKQLKGGYPLKKLALFRVGAGEYERIDEDQWSKLDMEVHEHPVLQGEIGVIKSKIDHQDYRGVSHYVIKHDEYAAWEAGRFLKSSNDTQISGKWSWKQKLKYRLMNSVLIGPAYFCGSFFLLGGFRDGARGLAFAMLKMAYFTQVYCKIQENKTR
ncbi:glycosyltransferase family 2 protein [Pontibacter diazotrophicus]|uniref:Glycosyltransferase family 2 protein n=1 Tax=Pontibacter diazotrophicus TaxID=1400979 RepID=A0A3D8L270_9BACT|nr:glycosyltransferase family 2 protein [Pontibacter diazotrophicus]RDV11092.1 glycosyltransferase family 2 protein [Pontibacter diazotrophicus]